MFNSFLDIPQNLRHPWSQTSPSIDRRKGGLWNRGHRNQYTKLYPAPQSGSVTYTYSERTVIRWSYNQAYEIIRMLCKDQHLNIPHNFSDSDEITLTTEQLNVYVAIAMQDSTPINHPIY